MSEGKTGSARVDRNVRLLRALAEELRLPLMQIARTSELAQTDNSTNAKYLSTIETTADAALRLIDSYLFSTQVLLGQQQLDLQPVSVSATIYDTAQYLRNMAKLYDCDIDIRIGGKAGLVMAHPEGLQAALTSLAYSMINAGGKKQRVVLLAQKTKHGVTTGVMTTNKHMPKDSLQQARRLFGVARRPMQNAHNNGAGIYLADYLFDAMSTTMKVSKQKTSSGLVAILLPSQQLALL